MDENEKILQAVAEYYRNKCNKLEYDFLIYKINSERVIQELQTKQRGDEQQDSI